MNRLAYYILNNRIQKLAQDELETQISPTGALAGLGLGAAAGIGTAYGTRALLQKKLYEGIPPAQGLLAKAREFFYPQLYAGPEATAETIKSLERSGKIRRAVLISGLGIGALAGGFGIGYALGKKLENKRY